MADYKYLKENNLFEAHMRFVRALGEGYGYAPIEEADDDPNQGQDPNGGMPGGDPNAMGGQDPMMGGGSPDGMGGMPGGDPNAQGGDMGADPNGGMPGGTADGGAPMPPMGDDAGMPGIDENMPQEEDNVIDVDDITDAQEKTNDKINAVGKDLGKVDSRIEKLLGAIDKLESMFDKNNQQIADLRNEFEKRNPTQTEKLNLRSLDSYPFKVKPTDYWQAKQAEGNYLPYSDNEEPTTSEFVITNNDVDDFSEREIADSFSIDDDLANIDIKRIFGI